jgi:hypothetical protein
MINANRIVSVTRTDLITLYGTAMKLAGTSVSAVQATDPGVFAVTGSGSIGNVLAAEPVKVLDFVSGVTAAVVYFVADYDFEGFKVAGAAVTASGATVDKDAATLYSATLSGGNVTIAKVGF